jgi:hypothetical protein
LDHPRAAFAPHRVTLRVKAVLGLSQVFRSYYLRAPKFMITGIFTQTVKTNPADQMFLYLYQS